MEEMQDLSEVAPAGGLGLQAAGHALRLPSVALLPQHHHVGAPQPPGILAPSKGGQHDGIKIPTTSFFCSIDPPSIFMISDPHSLFPLILL